MSPDVINCLKNEMKVSWNHFETKYFSFNNTIQSSIDNKLLEMLEVSNSIKAGNTPSDDFNALFYEEGGALTNEFIQAMFDCFREWQSSEGIQLHKNLYGHTNRGTDNWFPVVIIEKKINEYSLRDEYLTVYRGCSQDEYDANVFHQRQAWTTDIDTAKVFAFCHPSTSTNLAERIVIKAVIKTDDVLWDRKIESEIVLRLGFTPKSTTIVMTYDDYQK